MTVTFTINNIASANQNFCDDDFNCYNMNYYNYNCRCIK